MWGDLLVIGPFWFLVSIISVLMNNWILFLLFISLFWVIRSLGEMVYWLNEQFAYTKRNPPPTLSFHKLVQGDAIWFIYQLFWQAVFVFSAVITIYLVILISR